MGKYYKIYLTDVEDTALTYMQEKRKESGGNDAANAIFKDALRDALVDEGVAEWVPGMSEHQPDLFRALKPESAKEPEVETRPVRNRRRRIAPTK